MSLFRVQNSPRRGRWMSGRTGSGGRSTASWTWCSSSDWVSGHNISGALKSCRWKETLCRSYSWMLVPGWRWGCKNIRFHPSQSWIMVCSHRNGMGYQVFVACIVCFDLRQNLFNIIRQLGKMAAKVNTLDPVTSVSRGKELDAQTVHSWLATNTR